MKVDDKYRSFISEIELFHEKPDGDTVNVWVAHNPDWLPSDQPLYLKMSNFTPDFLRGIYYYPGSFKFYVSLVGYEIKDVKYVEMSDQKNCLIL